jgi:hypothetical protein
MLLDIGVALIAFYLLTFTAVLIIEAVNVI